MGFDALLGNARLKENLTGSIRRGRISHFYLISGPDGSGKRTLARLLSAAVLCREQEKPCLKCSSCRKVMENVHPDVITVVDPEHKNVSVKHIRDARESIFIRPNEGDRKVYIFPQDLGVEGQNALLKVLEEPPSYGVFLLLTDNPEKLLPTIRSRCAELSLGALSPNELRNALKAAYPQTAEDLLAGAIARSGGYLGQAKQWLEEGAGHSSQTEAFAKAFATRDSLGLLHLLVPMEKWKRDQFTEELNAWATLLWGAITCRSGMPGATALQQELGAARSARELMAAHKEIQKAMQYAQGNVSVAAICGHLAWVLR